VGSNDLVLIKQLVEQVKDSIQANDQRYSERHDAAQQAIAVALETNNKRLDNMNEFREALNDTNTRMISRVEALSAIQSAK
jgi:hypothetical protein